MGIAVENLWLVQLATFILQSMEHTNHKFPAATATGVPSEVKSTVHKDCHSAGEPYDVDQPVVKYILFLCKLWLLDFWVLACKGPKMHSCLCAGHSCGGTLQIWCGGV